MQNVTIEGINDIACFKYVDSLYYGSWVRPNTTVQACGDSFTNSTSNSLPLPDSFTCNTNITTQASIGLFIYANAVHNLAIKNLAVDGNCINVLLGGFWGDVGRQIAYTGISLWGCTNVNVQDCTMHHFGLDGIYIRETQSNNISISNSSFEYNGRQGMSWVGGQNLSVNNCNFNNTGRANISTPPASGVDIEPTDGGICNKGIFSNCNAINNAGNALIQDSNPGDAIAVQFNNCTFHNVNNYAVWVKGRKVTFTDCRIWGGFVHGYSGSDVSDATQFMRCDFADEALNGLNSGAPLMISDGTSIKMLISECTFRRLNNCSRMMYLKSKNYADENQRIIIKNTSFTNYSAIPQTADNALLACILDGSNSIRNNVDNFSIKVVTNGLIFLGSGSVCNRNSFSLEGRLNFSCSKQNTPALSVNDMGRDMINGTTSSGYFDFIIGAKSLLYNSITTASIGKNARLIVRHEGQLYSNGNWSAYGFNNAGKVILEDGSYTYITIDNGNRFQGAAGGTAEFYKSPDAILGKHPVWWPSLSGTPVAALSITNSKVYGSNGQITAGSWSTSTFVPNLTTLKSDDKFSVMYTAENPCSGLDGKINIKPIGYEGVYALIVYGPTNSTRVYNGQAGQATTIDSLAAGSYTVVIMSTTGNAGEDCGDGQPGCTVTFQVELTPCNGARSSEQTTQMANKDCMIRFFPNPADAHIINFERINNCDMIQLIVTNTEGKVFVEKKHAELKSIAQLDITNWPPGTYFVQANFEGGITSGAKFIVMRQ